MFIGEYQHNLDDKGRLAVPAKFRELLTHGLVATRGLDNCLFVYTLESWKELAKKLANMSFTQKDKRAFNRSMFSGASDLGLDSQGRVLLPENLRNFANLKKEVVIIGVYDRLEIWDKEKWENYRDNMEESGDDVAERLGEISI